MCVCVCLCQGISLHLAARQGDLDTVKHLVDEGDDINSKDKNGVRMTIEQGYISTVDLSTQYILCLSHCPTCPCASMYHGVPTKYQTGSTVCMPYYK